MIRVLHIDDNRDHHELTKTQLYRLTNDIELESVTSLGASETALKDTAFDVILADDQLSNDIGVKLLRSLREKDNLIPFIILSDTEMEEGQEYKLWAYHEDEFHVVINFGRYDLLNYWIHSLTEKHKQHMQTSQLKKDLYRKSPERLEQLEKALGTLTKREVEILDLIAAGDSNKDIAKKLGVSYRTVVNHVYNLFSKLGIHSRSEAIHIGLSMKLTNER